MGKTLRIIPATALDYRHLAERRLPRFLFDYIDGGANDERTLASNVDDFGKVLIKQRVLRDVDSIDTTTTLAGMPSAMPVALAPIGLAGMFNTRGEVQGVRAANAAGVPFTLSTVGICGIEEVRAASGAPFWFQLYMIRDRSAIEEMLSHAWNQGCTTLVFTVDLATMGLRHRDTRNGMLSDSMKARLGKLWQLGTRPGWVWNVGIKGKPHGFGNLARVVPDCNDLVAVRQWVDAQMDPTVTWDDIAWLRKIWTGRLILKGIMEAEDARMAVDAGADGLVVSNHGGRQLDGVASSISRLPAVVDAVGDRLEVWMDGGVRSGVDVFKAVALGARGVLIGRPWAWALGGAGEAGIRNLLATMQAELKVAMALAGVTRTVDIQRSHLD
jgi:L-lactate dehydrogenase (cytochrome)